jgi:bifunctional DNA-binding transcriptional regulator/antitoxin component of YhaV-PrlF toxin-antitoxin module
MKPIRLTSKRQATLPSALCEELGVGPGDTLHLERASLHGEAVWIIRSQKPDWSWFGAAKPHGKGKSHDLDKIERSIERGQADGSRS